MMPYALLLTQNACVFMANNVKKSINISPEQEKFLEENPDVNLSSLARDQIKELMQEKQGGGS